MTKKTHCGLARVVLQRLVLALVIGVCTACAGGLGDVGRVGDNEWTLIGATPDDQQLLVVTRFGGCPRFEEWQVEVTAEVVDVRARLWEPIAPEACNDIGLEERWIVELDDPLGDRELRGCGRDDCLAGAENEELGRLPAAAILDAVVVAPSALAAEGLSPEGDSLWQTALPFDAIHAAGDGLVAMRQDTLVGISATTGDELWERPGHRFAAAVEDGVLACSGGDSELLSAIDVATGEIRWTVASGCQPMAIIDGRVVIATHDPLVDGGMRLVVVDPAVGKVLVDRPLDDGIDDQVAGIDGIAAAGSLAVLAGPQSDLVVVDASGEEFLRTGDRVGWPIGSVGSHVVVDGWTDAAAVDPATGETVWFSPNRQAGSLAVSGGALFAYDRESGSLSRFPDGTSPADPGDALWQTPVGRSGAWSVSVSGDVAVVTTRLAVLALDATTGEQQWWVPVAAS